MNKDRFEHHCLEAEAGNDTFVRHPSSKEEGRVIECSLKSGHVVVQTSEDQRRCWDYRECEDLDRTKVGPML